MNAFAALSFRFTVALTLFCTASAASNLTAASSLRLTGRAMGTSWSAQLDPLPAASSVREADLKERLAARLESLEQIFSTYRANSEISRFNAHASIEWFPVSPEVARLALAAHRISEITGGVFDVTVFPLVELWGFGPHRRSGALPTDAEIAAARTRVDFRRLEVRTDPPALRKTSPTLAIDFSSMAKGFAVDELSALLLRLGQPRHLVQIGGDMRAAGRAWKVGIEEPSTDPHVYKLARSFSLPAGSALSTSSDVRNSFTVQGRRYGHILDPRTGRPIFGDLASVSVIAPSCAESSAWATALFALGAEAGPRIALEQNIAALFLMRDGENFTERTTTNFSKSEAARESRE